MKITQSKTGAWTIFDKESYWYIVKLYSPSGNLHDKMRCDDYKDARAYLKSFNAIAKNLH